MQHKIIKMIVWYEKYDEILQKLCKSQNKMGAHNAAPEQT